MGNVSDNAETGIESFLARHERSLLWSLCAFALLRIFFFSAAFPFFNNVDEQAHFDTVVKYSKGYLPRKERMNYERESAQLIILYGSPEYFNKPGEFRSGKIPPPLWHYKQHSSIVDQQTGRLVSQTNHESSSFPIYYALAGVWYNLGKQMGIAGGHLLYWVRFLNIPLYALLFWIAHLFSKKYFPDSLMLQLVFLLLLSCFPQDVFYSINSDALSAPFAAISFYLLIKIHNADKPSAGCYALTGIMVAATVLVKTSNFPILVLFAVSGSIRVWKLLNTGRLKEQWTGLLFMASGCMLPIILWFGWNLYAMGDITGSTEKISSLGWTLKPFDEIREHPIFSLKGFAYFISELLKTFWRGEFVWGLERIASAGMDFSYVISSCLFVICSMVHSLAVNKDSFSNRLFINGINTLALFLWISFLALLSIVYNFGDCWYPSEASPFFTSGRLMMGMLIPFLILYIDGLDIVISWISKNRINLLWPLLLICILITCSEFRMTHAIMKSSYNWFHMF